MKRFIFVIIMAVLVLGSFSLWGCSSPVILENDNLSSPTAILHLKIFKTMTPPLIFQFQTLEVTSTPKPIPTQTPFLYTIKADDTLLEVAWRFGVTLQAIKNANPSVNPNLMSVGQVIVIPLQADLSEGTPTPIPHLVDLDQPKCYAAGGAQTWCLVIVKNLSPDVISKPKIQFEISSENLTEVITSTGTTLLDRLEPGKQMIAGGLFVQNALNESGFHVNASIVDAQSGSLADPRYIVANIVHRQVDFGDDGRSVIVGGMIQASEPFSKMWLVAAGYGESYDEPAGIRRWEVISHCKESTQECEQIPFEFRLYSLGPAIKYVDLFVEALR